MEILLLIMNCKIRNILWRNIRKASRCVSFQQLVFDLSHLNQNTDRGQDRGMENLRDEPFNIYPGGGGYQNMTKRLFAGGKSWTKIVCK